MNEKERVEKIKKLVQEMAELGVIRITYDPVFSEFEPIEIWGRTGPKRIDRTCENVPLTREEKEFFASEYDKCFGTAPRSDEN